MGELMHNNHGGKQQRPLPINSSTTVSRGSLGLPPPDWLFDVETKSSIGDGELSDPNDEKLGKLEKVLETI